MVIATTTFQNSLRFSPISKILLMISLYSPNTKLIVYCNIWFFDDSCNKKR